MVDMFRKVKILVAPALLALLVSVATLTFSNQTLAQESELKSHGVVLIYHRFGEENYPSTNITIEQFSTHIAELSQTDKYDTISLEKMVNDLEQGKSYDKRTISVTVDDAYKSIITTAWPMLKAANIPLTIFVATDTIANNSAHYMSWDDIRLLHQEGATIAHHGASHQHYIEMSDEEIIADLTRASAKFEKELGFVPGIFAYPFGEYDERIKTLVAGAGFKAAFTQLSGPIGTQTNLLTLPRFPLNERYGGLDRFKLITGTLPLDIEQVIPDNPVLTDDNNPPLYGFSLKTQHNNLNALACYPSHLGKAADITILNNRRVEIRFDLPFPEGRNKINCTMPAGSGRWFWLGSLFIVKEAIKPDEPQ